MPCVAAVSCRADGSGFAFGLAARPGLEAAARAAVMEMCQFELADSVVATKRSERGDDALNAQDRIHLQRAVINADQCILLQPIAEPATHLSLLATEAGVIFGLIVQRLENAGNRDILPRSDAPAPWRSGGPRDCPRPATRAIRNRHGQAAGCDCANRRRRNLYRRCLFDIDWTGINQPVPEYLLHAGQCKRHDSRQGHGGARNRSAPIGVAGRTARRDGSMAGRSNCEPARPARSLVTSRCRR